MAMSSPISPAIANIFMEQFEKEAFRKTRSLVPLCRRHIRDMEIQFDKAELHKFLNNLLNNQYLNIHYV